MTLSKQADGVAAKATAPQKHDSGRDFESEHASLLSALARRAEEFATPRVLYDIAGSHVAGTILIHILYWHQSDENGDTRLHVEREGQMWLVRRYADFWVECRASAAEAEAALRHLADVGLLECRVWKSDGDPAVHIRLIEDRFSEMWAHAIAQPNTVGTYRPRKSRPLAPARLLLTDHAKHTLTLTCADIYNTMVRLCDPKTGWCPFEALEIANAAGVGHSTARAHLKTLEQRAFIAKIKSPVYMGTDSYGREHYRGGPVHYRVLGKESWVLVPKSPRKPRGKPRGKPDSST